MALAMLSHFLFQTFLDILIPIVCGLRVIRSAVMLVLIETLTGIDRAHIDDTMLTSGAPFILQV